MLKNKRVVYVLGTHAKVLKICSRTTDLYQKLTSVAKLPVASNSCQTQKFYLLFQFLV